MEGSRITCGLWLLVFLSGCLRLSAFNLDTDNVLEKSGEQGSLFSFSLVMHRQLKPVDKKMLLVGAPRAKALGGQTSKVTGGLYSCDMSSPSTACTRIDFDNAEDPTIESKENQWMGVSVSSQGPGGKVLTCAHRYQLRSKVGTVYESRAIIGRCVVMDQDLTIDTSSYDEGIWQFCEQRPAGHAMFGSCQQGLSATFDKQYHYLIFGAPGTYDWKGIVRLEQRNESLIFDEDGPFEVGHEKIMNDNLVPVPPSSYLGFSLDSGTKLTNQQGELTVVAGAPRAFYSGAVLLLKKGETGNMKEEFTLKGEGLASSFGYDLTVVDLNGDGWEDIVVGAPQYFEKDGTIGGAIYVYVNKAGRWNEVKPTRIDGAQDSMFGLAVKTLGDINQDGFQDFAVGAPYEDDGAGKVYIFHGSATGLKSTKAAQVLSSKPGVKLFGYSLAGNMDLDGNSYPDLAVGSLSDSVFVYKTSPVINIKKEIKFSPKEIDFTNKNCGDNFCLDVETCLTYTANPASYAPKLMVAYTIEADADIRKASRNSRVTFPDSSDNSYESKGVISMDKKGKEQCFTKKIVIQDNIRDRLNGIPIDVSVTIQESKRKRRQSSTAPLSPVLDANDNPITRAVLHFLKEGCGSNNICQSKLQVKYRYGHRPIDGGTFTELKMENGVPVISLSDQKDVALEVHVTNPNGDDAHEATVDAIFPPSLTYTAYRVPTHEQQVSCSATDDGSMAHCDLGNPFKRDTEATFYIYLSTSSISSNTTELEVDLQLNTTSVQLDLAPVKAKAKVNIKLQLSLTGIVQPSQLYFSGVVKGETAMKSESEIGNAVTHHFRVINLGKRLSGFGTATLNIEWPKETKLGKWLIYLMKISSTGVEPVQCSQTKEVNPLNMLPSQPRVRRATGNSQEIKEGTISRIVDKKNFITLSCDNGAKCVTIQCPLRGLDSNAVVTFKSRLWNGTFIEDFSELHHVEVIVKASLQIESTTKNTVLQQADTQLTLTVFPERRAEGVHSGVPWWIIVLSVLFGLLLLALLAFLLWKCGLFGKKKEDPSEKERLTPNA